MIDPREVLEEAGVDHSCIDELMVVVDYGNSHGANMRTIEEGLYGLAMLVVKYKAAVSLANDSRKSHIVACEDEILRLHHEVDKYKWQRDMGVRFPHFDQSWSFRDVIDDLDRLWKEHKCQH